MKKHHLFAYYCTLLLPIGAIIGAGIGSEIGRQVTLTVLGAALGIVASAVVVKSSQDENAP